MRLFVVALALLLAGFVNVARGLDRAGPDYRPWALHHGSYSDVIALGGDRYLDGDHPVPYIDDRIEYPVIMGFFLWAPSLAPGGAAGHFVVTSLLLAACLVLTLLMLRRIPGANPWLFAASPALALYGVLNWDLLGIALLVAGVAYSSNARRSGLYLGLGAAAKLFPIAAVPALWRTVRSRTGWLAAAAAVVVVINVPFALAAFDNWAEFFRFSSRRPPDFSMWNALSITSVPVINVVTLALVAATALVVMRLARTPVAARYGLALLLAVWLGTNKVSSPQYCLWVFAAAAIVSAPWPMFAALVAVSTFDFACELWLYPHHGLALHPVVGVMVVLRTATVLWFGWWCWQRLRIEVALDQSAQSSSGVGRDGTGRADGLHLAR